MQIKYCDCSFSLNYGMYILKENAMILFPMRHPAGRKHLFKMLLLGQHLHQYFVNIKLDCVLQHNTLIYMNLCVVMYGFAHISIFGQ